MNILKSLLCALPCVWSLLCLGGWAFHKSILAGEIYVKKLPDNGFPTDAERRRFYVEDPLDQRRRKIFKATLIWPGIFVAGAIIGGVAYAFFQSYSITKV